ncbi:MAG: phosphate regulon sensor histidine kinase PhoR [Azonexus sp.]|nr:phosphate regulon sensor histidine kinase PhoR [Azonexus sp.]
MNSLLAALLLLLAIAAGLWVIDRQRARRFLRWIADPTASAMPDLAGAWGLAAAYTRRALGREETRAAASAARLDTLLTALDALPDGILLLDREGRILFCNAAAAAHFGLDTKRDQGQHIAHLVRDPLFVTWFSWSGEPRPPLEMPGHPDASGQPVQLLVQRQAYGADCLLLLSADITAQRQTDAMRRDFVANVSHDIRTPLTVLAGFIETLQNLDLSAAEKARYLGLMAQQTRRMQALVGDLLTLSRLEGSPLPSQGERVDLNALTAHCAAEAFALSTRLYGPEAQHLRIETAVDFDFAGSASEIGSAMSNLLANAVRYAGAKGCITARWSRDGEGQARFEVTDNGPGIAAEHLPRLTERFYRLDKSRARFADDADSGTGLGLAITRHVVERHGGKLQIVSAPGQGSRFALLLASARVLARA